MGRGVGGRLVDKVLLFTIGKVLLFATGKVVFVFTTGKVLLVLTIGNTLFVFTIGNAFPNTPPADTTLGRSVDTTDGVNSKDGTSES